MAVVLVDEVVVFVVKARVRRVVGRRVDDQNALLSAPVAAGWRVDWVGVISRPEPVIWLERLEVVQIDTPPDLLEDWQLIQHDVYVRCILQNDDLRVVGEAFRVADGTKFAERLLDLADCRVATDDVRVYRHN
jgi:hypothetical protein